MNDPLIFSRHRLGRLVAAGASRHDHDERATLLAVRRRVLSDPALREVAREDEIMRQIRTLRRRGGPDALGAA